MSDIKDFRAFILRKLMNIPDFINTTSSLHYIIWNSLSDINTIMMRLISNSVIRETTITKLVDIVNDIFDDIYDITPYDLQINIIAYFSTVRLWLEKISIRYEFFESAANLKRFDSIYYQNNQPI
jgi:hypothetical protein